MGDEGAAEPMALLCNERAREILRLKDALIGAGVPDPDDTSADAVFASGTTGPVYAVLFTDARLLGERAADGDVFALNGLGT